MAKEITQRELRNESGKVMRSLDAGDSFVVTRNGVPVGELTPFQHRSFVPTAVALAAFRTAPSLDFKRFRTDIDAVIDQRVGPRG